jgi:tetratricopeptide (TPR) repeat protein
LGKLCSDLGDYTAADKHFKSCVELRRELGDMLGLAEALSARAVAAVNLRAYDSARSLGEEALQISRAHGDVRVTGRALHDLGMVVREQGDYARARQLYAESLEAWRGLGDLIWTASAALGLGITHLLDGHPAEAKAPLEEARGLYERLGDRYGLAVVATERGHLARMAGDLDQAIELFGQALSYFGMIGASDAVVYCIECLATLAAERNTPTITLRLIGAAQTARTTLDLPPPGDREVRLLAVGLDRAMSALGADAEPLLAAGRTLTLDQAREESLRFVASIASSASVARNGDQNAG